MLISISEKTNRFDYLKLQTSAMEKWSEKESTD